jgi:predicted double-glycine peptidase
MRTAWSVPCAVAFVLSVVSAQGGLAGEVRRPVKSLLEMRQENVTIQKWDLSCGAAALATLLAYQHGDPVSEREVARGLIQREEYLKNPEMVKERQGFSLLDLKRYADRRGYAGIGYGKLTLKDLIERAPVLVPIEASGYPHFVIFRGVMGNRVLLADPAWGNRTMPKGKFDSAWLEFPEIGKIGFVVVRKDGNAAPPNRLAPRPEEFLMLF